MVRSANPVDGVVILASLNDPAEVITKKAADFERASMRSGLAWAVPAIKRHPRLGEIKSRDTTRAWFGELVLPPVNGK